MQIYNRTEFQSVVKKAKLRYTVLKIREEEDMKKTLLVVGLLTIILGVERVYAYTQHRPRLNADNATVNSSTNDSPYCNGECEYQCDVPGCHREDEHTHNYNHQTNNRENCQGGGHRHHRNSHHS